MDDFCVYMYLRKDNTPYYIGRGTHRRPFQKHNGTSSCPKDKSRIHILYNDIGFLSSCAIEIFWIAIYGRKDLGTGILNNRTNGGEGATGYKHTEEHKQHLRETVTGRRHSEKTKRKLSALRTGSDNPMYGKESPMRGKTHTAEVRQIISNANKGKMQSAETRQKNREAHIGKKKSIETRAKMSKPKSAETKLKMSKPKELLLCPHCNKQGGKPAMSRWHFDMCKEAR